MRQEKINMTPGGIKKLRNYKGMSQAKLGKLASVPQWRISLIENGLNPRPGELEKIRKALLRND